MDVMPMMDDDEYNGLLSVRMIQMDHYMSIPIRHLDVIYSKHAGQSVDRVPVVRVFGTTQWGQKLCLHIHQVKSVMELSCSS